MYRMMEKFDLVASKEIKFDGLGTSLMRYEDIKPVAIGGTHAYIAGNFVSQVMHVLYSIPISKFD